MSNDPGDEFPELNSLVICGWSSQGHRMVKDLLAVAPDISITIINQHRDPDCPPVPQVPAVVHMDADATAVATLHRVELCPDKIVVLLADRAHGGPPQTLDARTILTALTIRKICPSAHVIAELCKVRNVELARTANVDEWILTDQFSGVMLSQSLQSSGLSELFTQLFETGAGSAFRQRSVPPELSGLMFSTAVSRCITLGYGALAGLRRGDDLHLPPRDEIELQPDDQLLLVQRI